MAGAGIAAKVQEFASCSSLEEKFPANMQEIHCKLTARAGRWTEMLQICNILPIGRSISEKCCGFAVFPRITVALPRMLLVSSNLHLGCSNGKLPVGRIPALHLNDNRQRLPRAIGMMRWTVSA
ncbi:hypothetical protein [Paenibacillus glycinis]|uniref:Uncharacterized protein n=1 Tax=Paenibacillus glycinis TaxID=2697035 RepID=A0ABW9XYH9_9BACL|nr:hypothetical protein [Paenibacillus glycinis]NBD27314.1 hypothetical protein [Paenibacillus glycinis]